MDFNFLPTGIGSLPYKDPATALDLLLKHLNEIPFWPQLPLRSFYEGMGAQFSEGIPGITIDTDKKKCFIDTTNPKLDEIVAGFYEKYLADDLDFFAINEKYSAGFSELFKRINSAKFNLPYIKGQITGPITFGALILDETGKAIMHHPLLADVLVKCLIMKARWQIKKIKEVGAKPIIFLDEPYLMGYGSAFVPLSRETVISQVSEVINEIHREDALAGIHCCGNTDWAMILDTPVDILNFDAFGFMDKLLIYSDNVKEFVARGGAIAWGIVPSVSLDKQPGKQELVSRLKSGIEAFAKKGVDANRMLKQSLLTPSCGLGGLSEPQAEAQLGLLKDISQSFR